MLKQIILILLVLISNMMPSQNIDIPKGIVYKYAKDDINKKAKELLKNELSDICTYSLFDKYLTIGPMLWKVIKDVPSVNKIEKGDITFNVPYIDDFGNKNTEQMSGKLIQSKEDFKIIWDVLKKEFNF